VLAIENTTPIRESNRSSGGAGKQLRRNAPCLAAERLLLAPNRGHRPHCAIACLTTSGVSASFRVLESACRGSHVAHIEVTALSALSTQEWPAAYVDAA